MNIYRILAGTALAFLASAATVATLSIGEGDGSLRVTVNEFGRSDTAIYDPLSPGIGPANTFFDNYIAVNNLGGFLPFGEFDVDVSITTETPTSLVSEFSINFLTFELRQSVFQNFDVDTGALIGATLQQQLSVRNEAEVENSFQLVRYLDGDLRFDDSIEDGGGVIQQNGTRVLFEIDSVRNDEGPGAGDEVSLPDGGMVAVQAATADIETTFVGINATGGTVPAVGSFEISSFSGLDEKIRVGGPLGDWSCPGVGGNSRAAFSAHCDFGLIKRPGQGRRAVWVGKASPIRRPCAW